MNYKQFIFNSRTISTSIFYFIRFTRSTSTKTHHIEPYCALFFFTIHTKNIIQEWFIYILHKNKIKKNEIKNLFNLWSMTWLDLKKEENVIECLEKFFFTILFIHSGTLPSCLNLLFTILTQYSYLYIKQVIFIIAMRTYFYFILHLQEQTPCSTMCSQI